MTHIHTHTRLGTVRWNRDAQLTHFAANVLMQFGLNWAKANYTRTHTHTHTRILYFLLAVSRLISSDFRKNSCGILLYMYFCIIFFLFIFPNFSYVFRFSFLLVVCLARILIIGNKFVFNSTTLRTKLKCRNRGVEKGWVRGGAEINVAYALQMMELKSAQSASTSWLDALLSARASTQRTDDYYVCGCVCVCVCEGVSVHTYSCIYTIYVYICDMSPVFCQCLNALLWPWNTIFSFWQKITLFIENKREATQVCKSGKHMLYNTS